MQAYNERQFQQARMHLTHEMIHHAERIKKQLGFGYEESMDAPDTYEKLKAAYAHSCATGFALPVYAGASDDTIYMTREGNWAFRFIHDIYHVFLDADFTIEGEYRVAEYHLDKIAKKFGKGSFEYRILAADTIGQVEYFHSYGEFPLDQKKFVRDMIIGGVY